MYTLFSARMRGENDIPNTESSRILLEKRMLLLILNTSFALRTSRRERQKKKKKRSFTYLGIPSIARSTPAMMLERKRQRALLRLRLRDVAARDDAEFFCCFLFAFFKIFSSRDCWQRGGGDSLVSFRISASSRRSLWIPRGTTRGGV